MDTQDVNHVERAPPPPKTLHTERDEEGDDAGSDQDEAGRVDPAADPYSNLDGAFGNYMADEPRPMAASRGGRPNDDDDLLF